LAGRSSRADAAVDAVGVACMEMELPAEAGDIAVVVLHNTSANCYAIASLDTFDVDRDRMGRLQRQENSTEEYYTVRLGGMVVTSVRLS